MRGGLSFPLIGTVLLSAPCVSAIAGLSMLSLVGLSAMFDHNKAESRISATLWLYQQFIETANERTPMRNMPNDIPAELPVAFYGSSKPVTHLDLMKVARTVLMELHLGLWDRVCVPVTSFTIAPKNFKLVPNDCVITIKSSDGIDGCKGALNMPVSHGALHFERYFQRWASFIYVITDTVQTKLVFVKSLDFI
jgi:hypothetical protein